jgi:hypothetical protein
MPRTTASVHDSDGMQRVFHSFEQPFDRSQTPQPCGQSIRRRPGCELIHRYAAFGLKQLVKDDDEAS